MKRDPYAHFIAVVLVGFFAFVAFVAAQEKTMFREAQGFMPDVVRVTAKMPDKGRICVEIPGGIDACRSISELRKWAQERALK